MRSTCPNCLSQVEHPHGEAQVICTSCGSAYSPFLAPGDDFSESSMAFKEIVDFGQNIEQTEPPKKVSNATVHPIKESPPKETNFETTSMILSTHGLGPQYQIIQWYAPLVRMVTLGEDSSPLDKALKDFQESALALGANAVTGLRCSLAPDNKRALLMGTPVKCERKSFPTP